WRVQFRALRAPAASALRRRQGLSPLPRTPFSAGGVLPPLRSGEVSLDQAEHFLHNPVASAATLRWCSGSSTVVYLGEFEPLVFSCPRHSMSQFPSCAADHDVFQQAFARRLRVCLNSPEKQLTIFLPVKTLQILVQR